MQAVAFCGLANPGSFWQTLSELGCRTGERRAFPDHHKYRTEEVKGLAAAARAAGCKVLLTTEKDRMNLPPETVDLLDDVELLFLKIGIHIEDEPVLMKLIEETLEKETPSIGAA